MLKPLMALTVLLLMGSEPHAFGGPCLIGQGAGSPPSIASVLRLSDDQKSVIAALHEEFEREFRPLQNLLLSKKSELTQLWQNADPDQARIACKESEIRDIQGRIQEISTRYHLKCRQILSPEQRKTLATFPNHYGGPRKGRTWINHGW